MAQNDFVEPENGSRPPVQQSVHQNLQRLINTLEKVHSNEMSSAQKQCQQIAKQYQQRSQEVQLLRNQLLQEMQAHEKTKQQLAQQVAANAQAQFMLEKKTADWSKCCKTLANLTKCLEGHQE